MFNYFLTSAVSVYPSSHQSSSCLSSVGTLDKDGPLFRISLVSSICSTLLCCFALGGE